MRNVQFRQSIVDFPVTVDLGDKIPSWKLTRWRHSGLRFIPSDDEGFSLQGDKRQLVYKGRRRSHRFTILGDSAFEYDCILEREPESNIITLFIEGAEKYDFFRQPDFVPDPFLKGSYAVYKKETLIGEGTGKLCHIHRPEIIDAQGRRCWGDLSIVGNVLRITIPEQWLGEAAYPVIVDPTVGTSTVGSINPQQYTADFNNVQTTYQFGVNRFLAPDKIAGQCIAKIYLNTTIWSKGDVYPVLFDDVNTKPKFRRSENEETIQTSTYTNPVPCWKPANFRVIDSVQSGSYIWFGVYGVGFVTNFDFGGIYYKNFPEVIYTREPEYYWDEDEEEWMEDEGDFYEGPDFVFDGYEKMYSMLPSWFFEYESQNQNFVRTITQGVNLTDSRTLKTDYKRASTQTVNGSTVSQASVSFFRQCLMNVTNSMILTRTPTFIRSVIEQTIVSEGMRYLRGLSRKCEETVSVNDEAERSQGFIREIADNLKGADTTFFPILFVRIASETQSATDTFQLWGEYIRGLYVDAGSIADTERQSAYYREVSETVQAKGTVFRGLIIFVKILTTSFVRDFILRRFLMAKDEIVLKSRISREITLDSRIN
jgi:hypothetical protein